ncbi:hypothetical protein GGP41_010024 [Bipolaris sorokiniana]|uniref:BTB domain-containing protein n=2 Tax=Cochliobolus sativus TaxID=45130 RepID=A0A8H5ZGP2_COCSA|nr:uncharacterized protein COCSADRAFT_174440 [Bipolaris sorokiniana ND90Pr]EMD61121.1 hypothetical protein COCSADRAFT_174440 [Bipolaris sorokiniana ND90Pr]KAF5848860.1 hypothetical protein GGP41_010024 [Bipolaris sorokiniana]
MEPRDPIITLNVKNSAGGTESFHVHQGVLCKSSKFFQNAMKQEWTRLKDKPSVIDLPDECTETVKIYIEWLYLDKNPIKRHKKGKEMQAGDSEKIYVLLAKAYVFGEKIIDPKYKNEMLINIESISIIYKGTPSNSPLRRLLATEFGLRLGDKPPLSDNLNFLDTFPKQALVDILKATVRERKSKPWELFSIMPYLGDEKS